ncbi:MAG: hypothetical protein PHY71_08835 [Bacteroidaceae bacterium]|nr:hypothetical protein [Bacteroidaceae bacterium]
MKTFLQLVAEDLYAKYNTDLSRVAVIFPNKRASLFFNQYLADLADRPLWSCAYLSISELFQRFSSLKKGDSIQLVCELYQIYKEVTGSDESLDSFYFWGELLISDFDDVDKNLVNPEQIFSNLKELKNILPEMDYLTPEEREAIERFFQHVNLEERSDLKDHFLNLWNVLGTIYERYNKQLVAKGIAYEGMLYRQVIDQLDCDKLPYDKYVFVGFNVLNKVEHHLFQLVQEKGKALFYWDYDIAYFTNKNHEAGEFIKRNLTDFPSELGPEHFDQLNKPKKICYIAAPTENVQARYLPEWMTTLKEEKESDCAVVLCNESLLQPVIHALPNSVEHSNVTMGFPLAQTPAFSYTCTILDLMDAYASKNGTFHLKEVLNVLRHPYTQQLSVETAERVERELTTKNRLHPLPSELCQDDWLTLTFSHDSSSLQRCNRLLQLIEQIAQHDLHTDEELIYTQLYQESLFKVYTTLMRFKTLMEEKLLTINTATFKLLLKRVLSTTSIPFHGEPVIGLQIMGVLETRNLDFKHLLLLSVNEGMLPKSSNSASFIPYNLRKAFGMTTIEHKNAVYAYYFYRLLQRAETVTILYNTTPDGINAGEMSRFLLQLLIDYPHTIERKRIETAQDASTVAPIVIEKDAAVMQRLSHQYELKYNPKALLSPSAMNM